MNIKQVLARSEEYLNQQGISTPRLDAEVLLADLLDMERIKLYVNHDYPLKQNEIENYRERIMKRGKERLPVAYITKKKEFMSLELTVNTDVLLPRPETEVLVEQIIDICQKKDLTEPNIVDVGTGSGAIMVSLGYHLEGAKVLGIDISQSAVKVARKNIKKHGLEDRLQAIPGNLLAPLVKRDKDNVDIVVSNPPYIDKEKLDELPPEVQNEPSLALDGGQKGLEIYQELIPQAKKVLTDNGLLFLEADPGQMSRLKNILDGWKEIEVEQDYSGRDRVIKALSPRGEAATDEL